VKEREKGKYFVLLMPCSVQGKEDVYHAKEFPFMTKQEGCNMS
jgi:hypothetical protein